MQGVLHDWGDDECIRILKKCREAIAEDKGKVIVVEAVIDEKDEKEDIKLTNVRLMLDMVMMAHTTTGKERTLKEWGYVLGEAGFSRHYHTYSCCPIRYSGFSLNSENKKLWVWICFCKLVLFHCSV